jgi:hypothetical protein
MTASRQAVGGGLPVVGKVSYLIGDFDNGAPATTIKRVERHVCHIPGRPLTWLYVEQVEVLPDGRRDAYFREWLRFAKRAIPSFRVPIGL